MTRLAIKPRNCGGAVLMGITPFPGSCMFLVVEGLVHVDPQDLVPQGPGHIQLAWDAVLAERGMKMPSKEDANGPE